MGEREDEILRAKTFCKAALPLLEEVVASDSAKQASIKGWNCAVQLKVQGEEPAVHILFENGTATVKQGLHEKPVLSLIFKNLKQFNDTMAGKKASLPKVAGMQHLIILLKVNNLLNSLKMLKPDYVCKNDAEKVLKVRLLLYMVAFALQEMSKGEDEYILKLTKSARKKIVEWTVAQQEPAVYVKIDEGRIKAFKGRTERRPYVGMDFADIEGALKVLTSEVSALDATRQQLVSFRGTAEYGMKVGNLMTRVGNFLMPE